MSISVGHQAPRSVGATWIRIFLALALVIPMLAAVARPAAAAASLQVRLLKDLNTGSSGSDSSVWVTDPVKAGTKYYFAAEVAGDTELFVSDGTPGNATKIDINSGGSSNPASLTPIPGTNKIAFTAVNGAEANVDGASGDDPRLFVSDGTALGTAPVPLPGVTNDANDGFYEVRNLVASTTKGVVFSGAQWDTQLGLEQPLVYDPAEGFQFPSIWFDYPIDATTIVGNLLTTVGDVLYVEMSDCSTPCDSAARHGWELWKFNLAATPYDSTTWQLVKELSPTMNGGDSGIGDPTTFGRALGVVDGKLVFEANPYEVGWAVYETDGTSAGTKRLYEGRVEDQTEATPLGSYLYFVPSSAPGSLWRVSSTTPAEQVAACQVALPDEQEVVGSTLYFPCDPTDIDPVAEGDQYAGVELFAVTNSATSASNPSIVFNAPNLTTDSGDGLEPMWLTAYDSKLYFSALDTTAYADRQLWVYTGSSIPTQTGGNINSGGDDDVSKLAVAGSTLFFRAEDGTHGNEPFVARVAYTLTVNGSGAGTGTVTGGLSINCTVTAGTEGPSGCSGQEAGEITLSPVADGTSMFDGWSGCDSYSGPGNVNCVVVMDGDTTVIPTFLVLPTGPWDLTVTKSGLGKGTVTSSTGFTCRGACSSASTFDIADGTTVTLTAKAASGSSFVGWQNVDCDEAQTSLVCTFDIAADETDVIARFEPKQTVSVLRSGAGAGSTVVTSSPSGIACGTTCSATFGIGVEVVLTATLASGSNVDSWTGVTCDEGESNTTTVCTFTVDGPAQVIVTTTAPTDPQYTLSLTNRTAYAITSSTGGINCGTVCQWPFPAGTITLSITMPQAYRPSTTGLNWSCGGCSISGGNRTFTATVTFVTSDLSYTVRRARY